LVLQLMWLHTCQAFSSSLMRWSKSLRSSRMEVNTYTSLATFGHSFPPARIHGGLLYLVQHLYGRLISVTAAISFITKVLVKNERRLLAYLRGQDVAEVC
jgi:hypothetical protein